MKRVYNDMINESIDSWQQLYLFLFLFESFDICVISAIVLAPSFIDQSKVMLKCLSEGIYTKCMHTLQEISNLHLKKYYSVYCLPNGYDF